MAQAIRSNRAAPEDSLPYVMNLAEAAQMLRLSGKAVRELVAQQKLPGRKIGKEYRFLRPALEDWLRGGQSHLSALHFAGSLAGDPYFPQMLDELAAIRKQANATSS